MPTSVSLTKAISCLGIIVSSLSLAPVIYTHITNRDHSTLLPFLGTFQDALLVEYHKKSITLTTLESLQGCLNTLGEHAIFGSLSVVACAGTNILLDFLLLIGACCGVRCLLLPWLIVSMLQLVLLGCPTVIFFSLLGTYLLLQEQFLPSLISFSTPTFLVLIAMTIWLTVLAAYWSLGSKASSQQEYNKATAKARLAPLDGYQVAHKPRHSRSHGHSHSHAVTTSNVNLYPTLPLA